MDRKIKILVIPSFYPTEDRPNTGIFFKEQSEALIRDNVEIGVIYVELRSIKGINIQGIIKNHFQTTYSNEKGINVIRRKKWNIVPENYKLGKQIWIKESLRLLELYINKYGKPDLIHAHCAISAGSVAKIAKEKYNVPYIITEHSTVYARGIIDESQKRIVRDIYDKSNKVLVVSNPFKELLVKKIKCSDEKMFVVPNFIDTDYFRNDDKVKKNDQQNFTFTTICFLDNKKRVDRLIKAFSNEFKGNEKFRLKIGGEGIEKNKLIKLAKDLGVMNQVDFLGALSRSDVKKTLSQSDCFVLPSDTETFGVVLIEALSMGLPVIATKSGGPEDIINDFTGYLTDKSITSLSEAMKRIVYNYNTFDKKKIRMYAVNNYSNYSVGNKILKEYKNIILQKNNV